MEPTAAAPPLTGATSAAAAAATTTPLPAPSHLSYPDSGDSSPRSRTTEISEGGAGDPLLQVPGGPRLRLMCSYGGQIVPRPQDKSLCYVGGDTRIIVVDRNSTLQELLQRLSRILLNGQPFTLKYQLPNEDLDSLITVSTEEDLENMIEEYDRLIGGSNPAKPSRIRLFLFPTKLEVAASMGPMLDGSNKSDEWFLNALNSAEMLQRGFSERSSVNCLLGLEENGGSSGNLKEGEGSGQVVMGEGVRVGLGGGKGKLGNLSNQDIHSVPDSPVLETTSSFGSTSSSPSLANLPPIKVRVEEGVRVFDQRIGVEDQFAQMGVSAPKQEEAFVKMSCPPTMPPNLPVSGVVTGVPAGPAGEYTNRVVSEDETSDHGVPVGYLKPIQPQPVLVPSSQPQQKQISGDFPSPDSVSSDSSITNAISRQKPVIYQDPSGQITSGSNRVPASFIDSKMFVTDAGVQVPVQQVSDSGYVLPPQYDQRQHQPIQQQQQQQQQQQTQPQQFLHAGNQYVHQHPTGGVPVSYYPVYSSQHPHPQHQHQIDQRYPVYYVPAGQAHAYNLPVQQQQQQPQQPPNFVEAANVVPSSQSQAPALNPTLTASNAAYNTARNVAPSKAEVPQAGVYMTTASGTPQLVQVPSHQHQHQHQHQPQPQPQPQQQPQLVQVPSHQHQHQHQPQPQPQPQPLPQQQQQFVGYSPIHHPSQSIAPTSAAASTYAYEVANPAHAQMHFAQPLAPQFAAQYQTMTSAPKMVLSDASAALPTDGVKPHMRTSQAL